MKLKNNRILWLGLLGGLVFAGSSCVVRGQMRTSNVANTSPPPPQYQTPTQARPGHVWVQGRWQMQNRRWMWQRGYWQPAQANMVWQQGEWNQQGSQWHWNEGRWTQPRTAYGNSQQPYGAPPPPPMATAPVQQGFPQQPQPRPVRPQNGNMAPTAPRAVQPRVVQPAPPINGPRVAPPAPKFAQPTDPRRGRAWQQGHYAMQHGQQVWVKGHWRAVPPNQTWIPGNYQWQNESYNWSDGHFEQARPNHTWNPGQWQNQNGVYVWIKGSWVIR